MYYSKEELEDIRNKGEAYLNEKEESSKGQPFVSAAQLKIGCVHCGHDRFESGKALLNTRGMTYLGLDWLNENATILICKRCGYIHWFNQAVSPADGESMG